MSFENKVLYSEMSVLDSKQSKQDGDHPACSADPEYGWTWLGPIVQFFYKSRIRKTSSGIQSDDVWDKCYEWKKEYLLILWLMRNNEC